jgi:hypothetical protein
LSQGRFFYATLSDVPAGQNWPVKYSFRYRKWYINGFNVLKDVQSSVLWGRYYKLGVLDDRKVLFEANLYFEEKPKVIFSHDINSPLARLCDPVHPISLQRKNLLEITLRFWVNLFYFCYRYFNSHENPRTKWSLFALLNRFVLKKSKIILSFKMTIKKFSTRCEIKSIPIFDFQN